MTIMFLALLPCQYGVLMYWNDRNMQLASSARISVSIHQGVSGGQTRKDDVQLQYSQLCQLAGVKINLEEGSESETIVKKQSALVG